MTISEMAIMLKEERYGDFGKTFRSPGHVCLLRGADGLVKNRRGHTEIGLAMCEMAGVNGLVLLKGEDIIKEYLKE